MPSPTRSASNRTEHSKNPTFCCKFRNVGYKDRVAIFRGSSTTQHRQYTLTPLRLQKADHVTKLLKLHIDSPSWNSPMV